MNTNDDEKTDLFESHLRILADDAKNLSIEDLAEKNRISSISLNGLNLTDRGMAKNWVWHQFIFAAVAVALIVIVIYPFTQRQDIGRSDLTAKGESKVGVLVERAGKVFDWNEGRGGLQNGDRVNAEVIAGDEILAFSGVYNSKGIILSDPKKMAETGITLSTGQSKLFPESFELVGANEGETLGVFVCRKAPFELEFKENEKASFTGSVGTLPEFAVPKKVSEACKVHFYKLR